MSVLALYQAPWGGWCWAARIGARTLIVRNYATRQDAIDGWLAIAWPWWEAES